MPAQHRIPVVLTRAKAQAERFAADLPEGSTAVISPLLRITYLPITAPPEASETLLFTSENGVAALANAGGGRAGQPALCVGDRTAHAATDAGFSAQSARGASGELIALARQLPGPFVHVRGVHTRGAIAETLRAAGRQCREEILYDQAPVPLTDEARAVLEGAAPSVVLLFSPRTATLFSAACPTAPAAHVLCLSPAVADALSPSGYASVSISPKPSGESLRTALSRRLRSIHLETKGTSG